MFLKVLGKLGKILVELIGKIGNLSIEIKFFFFSEKLIDMYSDLCDFSNGMQYSN